MRWGNDASHRKALADALKNIGQCLVALIGCVDLALCVLFFNQAGFVDFSSGNANHAEHSEFALRVAADGTTIYESAENVSAGLRKIIMHEVYPSPEAAVEAVEGELPGNPAEAHAVHICTHSDGKVSNETGGGRHLTWFRGHWNGDHHTTTAHQVLTQFGYQTTDTFRYSVSRTYCGCN